ncbi:MAG: hypothetical protein LBV16_05170, partial [Elusimicrobiota bacterium]|nr:hypothetical protein [Elusimicrobiota bacterium]
MVNKIKNKTNPQNNFKPISVGSDPSVCPSQINMLVTHKSSALRSGFIIAGLTRICAVIAGFVFVIAGKPRNLRRFLFLSSQPIPPIPSLPNVSIGNPFFNKIKLKLFSGIAILAVLFFVCLKSYGETYSGNDWTAFFAAYQAAAPDTFLNATIMNNMTVGANIGAAGRATFSLTGNSSIAIDGNRFAGFSFGSGKTGTFTNITLRNFLNSSDGGVINISGGARVTLTGRISFSGNSANRGGGIYVTGGATVEFTNATVDFTNNVATFNGDGGGAGIQTSGASHIIVNNSSISFINGKSLTGTAGAIYTQHGNADMQFTNSKLYMIGNEDGNANGGGASMSTGGGDNNAWSFVNTEVYIASSTTRATNFGGGISYVRGMNMTFTGSTTTFIYTLATPGYGGGFAFNSNAVSYITFTNEYVYIIRNTAAGNGGAIYFGNGNNHVFTMTNSTGSFRQNQANHGAIIYMRGGGQKVVFNGGSLEFIDNRSLASNSQGNISVNGDASIEIRNLTSMIARGNKAGYGGFLYLPNQNFSFAGKVVELTSNTAFNAANGWGGGLYFTNSIASFRGDVSSFSWNTAWGAHGGAMYIVSNSSAIFGADVSVLFRGNYAKQSGGGMYFQDSRAYFLASNSMQFLINTAVTNGGAMYFSNSSATFSPTSMTFNGNSAAAGGGMYFTQSTAVFGGAAASSMAFIGNRATGGSGGVMYFENSTATFSANWIMDFQGNSASQSGGGMYFTNVAAAYFRTARMMRFLSNSALNGNGGAMYFSAVPVVQFTP